MTLLYSIHFETYVIIKFVGVKQAMQDTWNRKEMLHNYPTILF